MLDRLRLFLKESRQEFRHINWPTREEAVRLTSIVIGLCLVTALFLGVFDYLFSYGLQQILHGRFG